MRQLEKHRLGDFVEILSGFAFDSENFADSGDMPIVRIRDVVPGRSSTFYSGPYDEKYVVRDGDMLIGMDGEFNLAKWQGGPALLNQRVCRIATSNHVLDDGYLFHFLPAALKAIEDVTPYVTVKHLSVKTIRDIEILLPPLEEQRRIARVLDWTEALRAKRRAALAQVDLLTQSIFLDLFGDPVRNERNWPTTTVSDLCELVRGSSPRPQGDPRFFGGPVPRLMVADITRDGWLVTPRIDSLTVEGAKRSRPVRAGSVVMAVSGNVGLVSRLAIDACVHDGFVAFTGLDEGRCQPGFLLALLHFSKVLHEKNKAGAIFINLTTTDIKGMKLPLPPIGLQREFARRVTAVETLKTAQRASLREMNALFASLQHRAFRGEL